MSSRIPDDHIILRVCGHHPPAISRKGNGLDWYRELQGWTLFLSIFNLPSTSSTCAISCHHLTFPEKVIAYTALDGVPGDAISIFFGSIVVTGKPANAACLGVQRKKRQARSAIDIIGSVHVTYLTTVSYSLGPGKTTQIWLYGSL